MERLPRLRHRLGALLDALRAFDDGAGLPAADPRFERAGRVLALTATALMVAVGLFEIDAPFGAGHYAAATAVLTAGENFWRFGTLAPLTHHPLGAPGNADYYCHHPFGIFWTAGLFAWLGHHEWVCRLPAVLMSALMPALVYGAGRGLFGPLAAGLSALAFAVLPITLAYANFFALEVPAMFGMALAVWGFVRFSQSGRRRFAAAFVIGLGYAMAADWPGFVFAALVLGWLLLRGFVSRRWFSPLPFERFATAWALAVALAVALAAYHVGVFVKLDQFDEFVRQGEFRSKGADLPLSQTLAKRAYWIALAFTPLGVWIGKLAVPVLAARALLERRDLEILPLAVLGTAIFQYVVFKQGADIHFFWPHYFALYFAYGFGALAATLERVLAWASTRTRRELPASSLAILLLALGALPLIAILPDGLRALRYARKSGARFNEKGYIIHADFDKAAALSEVARALPPDATLGVHSSMKQSYWMDWVVERPLDSARIPAPGRPFENSHFCLDTRFAEAAGVREFVRDFAVDAYGPFLFADLQTPARPLAAFEVASREPSVLERIFVSSTHALHDVRPSPFLTWELRTHYEQTPNPAPERTPVSLEELRIAHNVAVANGDTTRAEGLRARLFAGADRRIAFASAEDIELLALRFERGASDLLILYFSPRAPLAEDRSFSITSHVEAAPRLSLTPRDELAWDVGMPFAIPTSLWHAGFIYSSASEIVRRPGRERYAGAWSGRSAGEQRRAREITLLTLD
ncbi:MAG TPA: glycosyltransferase family 39 protein [Polyangiaceae bacterium]